MNCNRGQKTAGRKQPAAGSQRTEVGGQRTDDRGQMTASQMVKLSNSQMVMNGVHDESTI